MSNTDFAEMRPESRIQKPSTARQKGQRRIVNSQPQNLTELQTIAFGLATAHGMLVAQGAGLLAVTRRLFASRAVPASVSALQRECVESWLEMSGADPARLDSALVGLERGAETANYLAGLPD